MEALRALVFVSCLALAGVARAEEPASKAAVSAKAGVHRVLMFVPLYLFSSQAKGSKASVPRRISR